MIIVNSSSGYLCKMKSRANIGSFEKDEIPIGAPNQLELELDRVFMRPYPVGW